ncbi:hypothetical protein DRA46_02302 [Burkholderia gladioli]|nr:hypothetical protein [Burkholderia gladioli]
MQQPEVVLDIVRVGAVVHQVVPEQHAHGIGAPRQQIAAHQVAGLARLVLPGHLRVHRPAELGHPHLERAAVAARMPRGHRLQIRPGGGDADRVDRAALRRIAVFGRVGRHIGMHAEAVLGLQAARLDQLDRAVAARPAAGAAAAAGQHRGAGAQRLDGRVRGLQQRQIVGIADLVEGRLVPQLPVMNQVAVALHHAAHIADEQRARLGRLREGRRAEQLRIGAGVAVIEHHQRRDAEPHGLPEIGVVGRGKAETAGRLLDLLPVEFVAYPREAGLAHQRQQHRGRALGLREMRHHAEIGQADARARRRHREAGAGPAEPRARAPAQLGIGAIEAGPRHADGHARERLRAARADRSIDGGDRGGRGPAGVVEGKHLHRQRGALRVGHAGLVTQHDRLAGHAVQAARGIDAAQLRPADERPQQRQQARQQWEKPLRHEPAAPSRHGVAGVSARAHRSQCSAAVTGPGAGLGRVTMRGWSARRSARRRWPAR